MTRDIRQYESAYLEDYGFESKMVAYRRRMLLERLTLHAPKTVIEISCGAELLYAHYLEQADPVDCWIIVEPSETFASLANQAKLENLHVIQALFEEATDQIRELLPSPDLIICSGLLHEVADAQRLLASIVSVMDADTRLHVNIPNAKSFHRRLAKAMRLIIDLKTMSDRNINLLQHRVYDQESLENDLQKNDLHVIDSGGYFIKPFTHKQMENIEPFLGNEVLDGLFQLGKESPDLASEIYVEAKKHHHDRY